MNQDIHKIEATVADIEALRATVKERHSDNVSLVIRFDSVLKQLIDSLSVTIGSKLSSNDLMSFTPKPLQFVAGKPATKEVSRKVIEDKEIQTFVENAKAAYEGFLGRDNHDILEGLDEETLRGVAKLAGLEDFKTAEVNGNYVTAIKDAITAKNKLEHDQKAELDKIQQENSAKPEETDKAPAAKPTIAELKEIKEKATAEYTKLFGKAPASNLSGAKIQELINQKKADEAK